MDRERVDALWSRVLQGSHLEDHDFMLRFSELPSIDESGAALALDSTRDVVLDRAAWATCQELASLVVDDSQIDILVDSSVVALELIREAGRLLRSSEDDRTGVGLVSRLRRYLSRSVVVVPVGGMYSSAHNPLRIGDAIVAGHVSQEAERAIAELAREHSTGLVNFRFTDDAWWTEDFLAAESDGGIAIEIAEDEAETGTWQPLVIAVAVKGVGQMAVLTALMSVEALIGAALALDDPVGFDAVAPPWILGDSTFALNPRSPVYGDDFLLPTQPLTVDTRPDHGDAGHANNALGRVGRDVDLGELALRGDNSEFLWAAAAGCLTPGVETTEDSGFSEACRLFSRAVASPPDLGVLITYVIIRLLGGDGDFSRYRLEAAPMGASGHARAELDVAALLELVDTYMAGTDEAPSALELAFARHEALHLVRGELMSAHRRRLSREPDHSRDA